MLINGGLDGDNDYVQVGDPDGDCEDADNGLMSPSPEKNLKLALKNCLVLRHFHWLAGHERIV